MTDEEIQKLLGGYATNSLTDAERKALFEAALDNQELFDTIEREQALKDVLDDPVSRRQVREALEANQKQSPAWWARWWSWGVAVSAVAAVLVVVLLPKPDRIQTKQQNFDVAMAPKSPPPIDSRRELQQPELKAPELPASRKLDDRKLAPRPRLAKDSEALQQKEIAANETAGVPAAAPPPIQTPVPAQQQVQQSVSVGQSQAITEPVQGMLSRARNSVRDQQGGQRETAASRPALAAGYVRSAGGISAPPLAYLILKRDENGNYAPVAPNAPLRQGDLVRINVVPFTAGYLTLYERDNGGLKRLFPLSGMGIKVLPNTTYTVPDSPLNVKEEEQVTLMLSPESATVSTKAAKSPPVSVDISLSSKKE